jgi:leucyl aminopeptidase
LGIGLWLSRIAGGPPIVVIAPFEYVHAVDVTATTSSPLGTDADTIAVGVFEREDLADGLPEKPLADLLVSGEASPEFRRLAVTHAEGRRFILIGLGARDRFDRERARLAAAAAHGRARELQTETLCWQLQDGIDEALATGLVEGTLLHAYRFERYKRADGHSVRRLVLSSNWDLSASVAHSAAVARAQNRARDLGNTPANDLGPAALADYAQQLAGHYAALSASALDETAIREAGMGAFNAVAQGSAAGARLIRLEYAGGAQAPGAPALALIGKAITFDSGGLSLKPPNSMHDMKFDMAGGAAVIEAMGALAELNVPLHVIGLIGATENMPSGRAVRPGDIVRALDGTTIEINNTDAEGRLVLADCLCLARQAEAARIVDVATLTGGVVTALGSIFAGLFSNDDGWAGEVQAAGEAAGDRVWRLPLDPEYARMVEGRYAQLTNRAERREAQPVTAAEFLHHFAGNTPWAHLDIAGTGWDVPRPYYRGKGATGFGVRLLVELAERLAAMAPATP